MAITIVPALNYTSVTSDRKTGTISDVSVFGGSNPARNTFLVFLGCRKMNADSTVAQTIATTGNTVNPLTDSSWTFPIIRDGWYRFLYVILPAYSAGTTYAINDAVYNSSTNLCYISAQNSNTGNSLFSSAYWTPVSDPAALALNYGTATQSFNIASTIYEIIISANSEYFFANQIYLSSQGEDDTNRVQEIRLYELLGDWVDGLYVASDRSEFSTGERIAQRILSVATDAGL